MWPIYLLFAIIAFLAGACLGLFWGIGAWYVGWRFAIAALALVMVIDLTEPND